MNMLETLQNLLNDSGFVSFFADGGWKNLVMIAVLPAAVSGHQEAVRTAAAGRYRIRLSAGQCIQLLRRRCKLVQRPVPP